MKRHRSSAVSQEAVLAIVLLMIIHIPGFGQTGPGGVGNSSTNVLWLSADYGVYSDAGVTPAANGANVRQWNDRSGNGKHAVETTAANQPNFQTSQMNGLPVLRFSAANADRILSSGVTTNSRATVWVVGRYSSLPSPNPGLLQASSTPFASNTADKSIGIWISSSSPYRVWGRGVQSDNTQRDIPEVISTSPNTTYSICNRYGNSIEQFINGADGGSVTYNRTLKDWSEVGIGRQGTESWDGDIAEVIVFNTDLNEVQRIIIDNYLAAKYNFSLSDNDIYTQDDYGFDFDVAGIGRMSSAVQTDAQGGIVRINDAKGLGNNRFYLWGHDSGPLAPTTSDIPTDIVQRLQRVWSGTLQGGSLTFTLHVDFAGIGSPDVANMRLIVDTDGDGLFSDETTGTGGLIPATSVNGSVYTFKDISLGDGKHFTFGTAVEMLPVDLLEFHAEEENHQVVLTWATASEENNSHFTLERSTDGKKFDFVATVEGKGTTNSRTDYSFTDMSPYTGRSYYRLSQTDFNGARKYFPIVKVDVGETGPTLSVYPNPSNGSFQVTVSHPGEPMTTEVAVYDLRGHQLFAAEIPAESDPSSSTFLVNLQDTVPPGMYMVKVNQGGVTLTDKIFVTHNP